MLKFYSMVFHKEGKFSITRYILVVWMHLMFFKFLLSDMVIRGHTFAHDLANGWLDLTQIIALLYVGNHNISYHGGIRHNSTIEMLTKVTNEVTKKEEVAIQPSKDL